jgi:hypothetical protein
MSGSGVQLPKWKSYTLPSVEKYHILREPPKAIHTRKKERVDMSNVTHMIRNDDSRINEGISYLQRGVNPHVDVMYNNVGGGGGGRTNTMPNIQASNPYKVMKDGAFRPPMYKQEDLLPLSRQRRPETIGITNPGVTSGYNIHNLVDMIDKSEISSAVDVRKINYISIRPTATYKMELPREVFTDNAINHDVFHTSASAGFKGHTTQLNNGSINTDNINGINRSLNNTTATSALKGYTTQMNNGSINTDNINGINRSLNNTTATSALKGYTTQMNNGMFTDNAINYDGINTSASAALKGYTTQLNNGSINTDNINGINRSLINTSASAALKGYTTQMNNGIFTDNAINYDGINTSAFAALKGYTTQMNNGIFTDNAINYDGINTSASAGFRNPYESGNNSRLATNDLYQASKNPLNKSAISNIKMDGGNINRDEDIDTNNYIKDNIILENISPNFSISVYNPATQNYSEVLGSTKERMNIAVQSSLNRPISLKRNDGTDIRIKDYKWQIVTSAVGGDNLVLQLRDSPDIELERNMPLYSIGSNISGHSKSERFHTKDPITNKTRTTSASAATSMKYGRKETIHDKEQNIELRGMGSVGSFVDNFGTVPTVQNHNLPKLKDSGMNMRHVAANEMSGRYDRPSTQF